MTFALIKPMKLKTVCSLLLIANTYFSNIYSQHSTVDTAEFEVTEIVKASAYSPFNFFTPAVQFSYEKEYKPHYAWQLDVGYINDFNYNLWDQRLNGFRVRFEHREYRHYYDQLKYYHGFAIQTKQTLAQNEEWIGRYDFSYVELRQYTRWTASFGAFFAHGFQSNFEDSKGIIDIGMMYGFRAMHRQYYNLPADSQLDDFFEFGVRQGWYFFPTVFGVLKFGIKL